MGLRVPAASTKGQEKPANDIGATPMTTVLPRRPTLPPAAEVIPLVKTGLLVKAARTKYTRQGGRRRGKPRLALPHNSTRQGGHHGGYPRLALPHNELTSWIAAPSVDLRGYLQTLSAPPRPRETVELRGYLQTPSAPPRPLDNGTPPVPTEPEAATNAADGATSWTVTAATGSPCSPTEPGAATDAADGAAPRTVTAATGESALTNRDQAGAIGDVAVKNTGLLGRPGYYKKPKQETGTYSSRRPEDHLRVLSTLSTPPYGERLSGASNGAGWGGGLLRVAYRSRRPEDHLSFLSTLSTQPYGGRGYGGGTGRGHL